LREPDSLIAPIHSLFDQKKFFVPLRREFRGSIFKIRANFSVVASNSAEFLVVFPLGRESRFTDRFANDWVVSQLFS